MVIVCDRPMIFAVANETAIFQPTQVRSHGVRITVDFVCDLAAFPRSIPVLEEELHNCLASG
ncbi:hypothetical protein DVK07_19495 [Halorubrum sp. Atlit-26R]|nr:hypothetical protein DVK07_19495 [Halorubrum sp. Atlit-26R]